MTSILVLGINGMLGHEVAKVLDKDGFTVYGLDRNNLYSINGTFRTKMADGIDIHNPERGLSRAYEIIPNITTVVNAIGMIKPRMQNLDIPTTKEAIAVNVKFPCFLTRFAEKVNSSVYQIATDCVFNGADGHYKEDSPHNADDLYGVTKSLGEHTSPVLKTWRTSIIGREIENNSSLVEWIANQPTNANLKGFTNHLWNGITTQIFGKLISGDITQGEQWHGLAHIIPADVVSKFELLTFIASALGRNDLSVSTFEAETPVDRTLSTQNSNYNNKVWENAGFQNPLSVKEMVEKSISAEKNVWIDQ